MKRFLIAWLASSLTSVAYAAPPKVECSLHYALSDAQGVNVDYVAGIPQTVDPSNELKIESKGFTLIARLLPVCAPGGRCSDSYTLYSSIKRNDVSSDTSTFTPFHRQYLTLKVGNESAISLCDSQ